MAAGLLDPSGGTVEDRRPSNAGSRRPARARLPARHADVLRRPVAEGAPRVRRPAARRRGLASTRRRTARASSASTTAPTTSRHVQPRPAPEGRHRAGLRPPVRRCCWSTSRSSVSTSRARPRCSALFDEAQPTGRRCVVATHELGFVNRADRLIALRDGEVRYDGAPGDDRRARPGVAHLT